MPYVSVIIPMHNSENFIKECLFSVQKQSLQDIEIICIDNGSSDNTLYIVENFAKEDPRIIIVSLPENTSLGDVRNIGLQKAQGKYIGFVNSNDTIDIEYFSSLYKRAVSSGADITSNRIVYISYKNEEFPGIWFTKAKISAENNKVLKTIKEKTSAVYFNCATSSCKHLFKRTFLIEKAITFPSNIYHEEELFIMKAFFYANYILCEEHNSPKYYCHNRKNTLTKQKKALLEYKKSLDQIYIFSIIENMLLRKKNTSSSLHSLYSIWREIIIFHSNTISPSFLLQYLWHIKKSKFQSILISSSFMKTLCYISLLRITHTQKDIAKIKKKYNKIKNIILYWRHY